MSECPCRRPLTTHCVCQLLSLPLSLPPFIPLSRSVHIAMVFLRLTVKIYPREQQLQNTQWSSSFSLRSFLGDKDRAAREDGDHQRSGAGPGMSASGTKFASFLLVLGEPDQVTLGALAGMIREKWAKLRPDAE